MNREQLPQHWKDWIVEKKSDGRLSAYDFNTAVSVSFEDGSHAFFDSAFAVPGPARNELAVFTEHCGYHIFPLTGTKWRLWHQEGEGEGDVD